MREGSSRAARAVGRWRVPRPMPPPNQPLAMRCRADRPLTTTPYPEQVHGVTRELLHDAPLPLLLDTASAIIAAADGDQGPSRRRRAALFHAKPPEQLTKLTEVSTAPHANGAGACTAAGGGAAGGDAAGGDAAGGDAAGEVLPPHAVLVRLRPVDSDSGALSALGLMRVAVASKTELKAAAAAAAETGAAAGQANGAGGGAGGGTGGGASTELLVALGSTGHRLPGAGLTAVSLANEAAATAALSAAVARAAQAAQALLPAAPRKGGKARAPKPGSREHAALQVVEGTLATLRFVADACDASMHALAAADPATPTAVLASAFGLGGQRRAEGSAQVDRRLDVVELPNKGRGYVANAPIRAGQRVLVERPLVFRRCTRHTRYTRYTRYTR